MAITPFGQAFPASWTTDGTIAGSTTIANSGNATSSAITNQNTTAGSEQLDFEFNLNFTYPNNAPTGVVTVYVLRGTPSGYQASTDPGVYPFTFTPTQNATNNYSNVFQGFELDTFKLEFANASGFSMTSCTLEYKWSQGQFG